MYNSSKALIYSKDELVRVGSYKSAYAIGRQDPEENKFDSFSYNVEVRKEKINDYDETISSARASGKNDGSNIIVSLSNMGNRTTNIYGLVIFYNNGKIVEIKDATAYNVMPTGVRDVTVEYPYNLSFSKFEVIVNEVGTEL